MINQFENTVKYNQQREASVQASFNGQGKFSLKILSHDGADNGLKKVNQ